MDHAHQLSKRLTPVKEGSPTRQAVVRHLATVWLHIPTQLQTPALLSMGQQGPWDLSEVSVGHLSSLCVQQEPRATVLPWAALNLASWLPHILKGPCKNDYLYGLTQRLAFHFRAFHNAALSTWHSCRLGCCSSISPSAPGTVDNKQYLEKSQREMIQAVEVAPIRDYHSCMWKQNWWLLPQFWNNPHMLILQPTALHKVKYFCLWAFSSAALTGSTPTNTVFG